MHLIVRRTVWHIYCIISHRNKLVSIQYGWRHAGDLLGKNNMPQMRWMETKGNDAWMDLIQ